MKWVVPRSGFDEVFDRRGQARAHYAALISILESFTKEDVERRERLQQLTPRAQGITFTVYGEKDGLERIFPFDCRCTRRSRSAGASASLWPPRRSRPSRGRSRSSRWRNRR